MRRSDHRAGPPRVAGLIAVAATVVVLVGGGASMHAASARRALAAHGCDVAAPGDAWFGAVADLDRAARLPWLRRRALEATEAAVLTCHAAYTRDCRAVRDAALERARAAVGAQLRGRAAGDGVGGWEDFVDGEAANTMCTTWSRWRLWASAEGVDIDAGCAVCDVGVP